MTRKDLARMPSRLARSAAAVALATSATTFAYAGSAAPAQAAAYDGYCKTSSGVTVVVDFRNLGGGVAIRCAPVGSGATGLDALNAAGIPVEQPRRAPGAVCRLYGKPAATQELPGGYHEQCVNMPPTNAYWSYWQASNGGSWGYSQSGAGSSQVIPGGFEGWSFSEGSSAAPRAAATRPPAPAPPPSTHTTQPPRHTTTTAPRHTSTTTARQPAPSKGDGDAAGASQPTSTASGRTAKSKAAKSKAAERKSTSAKAKASKSSSSSSSALSTGSRQPTNAAGAPIKNSDDLIKDAKQDNSSSINATTVVGGGVLGALAIGGVVVGILRRRNLG